MKDLKKLCPDTEFWGVGGDALESMGVELLYHLRDFSDFGFISVIPKIPFYFKAMNRIEREVEKRSCKVAILIDYQGFNLKLAKRLKKKKVEVLYYVAPQAWAWKAYRAKVLEKSVNALYTIIPFERKWFVDRGVKRVHGANHPLWTTYKNILENSSLGLSAKPFDKFKDKVKILLLPGSRNFEVQGLLPKFIDTVKELGQNFTIEVSLVKSPNVNELLYAPYRDEIGTTFRSEALPNALKEADVCIAASGTVTLATALFEVPTIVCYKTPLINELIFRIFFTYDGPVSLANIVHEKNIFPEFLQKRVTAHNIKSHLLRWLTNQAQYEEIKSSLSETKYLLQGDRSSVPETMSGVIKEVYEK